MLERKPAVMKNATNKTSTTPRASRFCAWLGGRLEMTKSCSSRAGGAVVIIEPHLRVIGVCLSALPAGQSNHQDPPESAFDEPEQLTQNQTVSVRSSFGKKVSDDRAPSQWPRFAKAR